MIHSEETKSKIGLANSKFYNVYNDKDELILHNVRIYDEEFKVYEFKQQGLFLNLKI